MQKKIMAENEYYKRIKSIYYGNQSIGQIEETS